MNLDTLKKIYFLGIGGIGMSAVARYFLGRGVEIHGYDISNTSLTKKLEAEGMNIHYEENIDLIPKDIDLVIMTPAIPKNQQELLWLKENGYPIVKRAEMLGKISQHSKTIAVAGTHGKTTTSSLIAHILKYCKLDISAFLGGILVKENSNFINGKSNIVVLEADEYDRSFLHLYPDVLVIISMDADHLDIYGTVEKMREAYKQLTLQMKAKGTLILGPGVSRYIDFEWQQALEEKGIHIERLLVDFDYERVKISEARYQFDYVVGKEKVKEVQSNLPGIHNVSNSSLAIRVSELMGVETKDCAEAVSRFEGVRRRFEIVYEGKRVLLDDYAHHPEELRYAVKTAKMLYPSEKVVGVFQPHLYSRTKDFYKGFAKELAGLDTVLLLPIYPAREEPIKGVSSAMIYNLIRKDEKYLIEEKDIIDKINSLKDHKVVITIGAADLDKHHSKIIEILKR